MSRSILCDLGSLSSWSVGRKLEPRLPYLSWRPPSQSLRMAIGRTKTQCKSDLTLQYWKSPVDLSAYLDTTVKALNPTTHTQVKPRLGVLCTKPVCCILLVTQVIDPVNDNAPGPPVIMYVSHCAIHGTHHDFYVLGRSPKHPLRGRWDTVVLAPFDALLNPEEPHCPVLAASEGYSCVVASATPPLYLEDANPHFFPSGELICGTVNLGSDSTTYCSFLLLSALSGLLTSGLISLKRVSKLSAVNLSLPSRPLRQLNPICCYGFER
jgi:hypothetical protein